MRMMRPYRYLATVQGMCRACREIVPCRVLEEGGAVYQERLCPSCGPSRARIADDLAWYEARGRAGVICRPPVPRQGALRGCPRDCGPCSFHANVCTLPVVSVTNACELRCPICFTYNRPDREYFMEREELRRILDGVVHRTGGVDLVNLTGGEPTMHPRILDLLDECRRPEIGRMTMNSNGLRLAQDPALCLELARLGAFVVLSLHTLRRETSLRLHGRDVVKAKLRALENLQAAGVGTTILLVLARGINEDETGEVLRLAKSHVAVRSITIQTLTFTGQGGGTFGPRDHLPLDGAAAAFEAATGGEVARNHFVPHPRAHPLCYSVAYYLRPEGGSGLEGRLRSFTEFLAPEELRDLLSRGYLLGPGDDGGGVLWTAVDRVWARGNDDGLLRRFRSILSRLYPVGRSLSRHEGQRICESEILTVYIHAHMDEDTLDVARLAACPDQVPDAEGRMIPACAYNLFYRRRDQRFYVPEASPWGS